MKVGIKFGPTDRDFSFIDQLTTKPDFIELFAGPGYDFSNLKKYDYPIVVHCSHFGDGVNFADPSKKEFNKEALNRAISVADEFDSKKIIIHPEVAENDSCTLDVAIDFIKENHDPRLLIENMPRKHSAEIFMIGCEIPDIKRVIDECNVGFCLDYAHAAEFAVSKGIDYKEYIKELLEFKPDHYHASDSRLVVLEGDVCYDDHNYIGKGEIDYGYLLSISPADGWVTLETWRDPELKDFEINFFKEKVLA